MTLLLLRRSEKENNDLQLVSGMVFFKNNFRIFIICCCFCHGLSLFAQTHTETDTIPDSLNVEIIYVYDTVYADADTIRIQDTVIEYFEPKFNYSVGIYYATLSNKDQLSVLEDNAYGKSLMNSKTPVGIQSGGLSLQVIHKNSFIETGISYFQMKEKFNYQVSSTDTSISFISDTITRYYVDIGTGVDTIFVIDEYYDTTTSPNNKQYNDNNQYSYIEIPLFIGHNFNYEKFSFYAKTGIIIGLLKGVKGKTISLNDDKVVMDISNQNPFIKTSYSLVLGGGVSYRLTKNISISAEGYYRQSVKSIIDEVYFLSQKQKGYGLRIGVSYLF